MTDYEAFCSLRNWITCIDGPPSKRQDLMFGVVNYLDYKMKQYSGRIKELEEVAERYRSLADQRLLNHLEIDQNHIIEVANEIPMENDGKLSQMCYDPERPVSIPTIPVEPIDFNYDP